jgi:uncharacterized protein
MYFSRMNKVDYIVRSSKYPERQAKAVVSLIDEGATIPFIARYRKERTGGLDELEITEIRDLSEQFNDLIARQSTIIKQIEEQGQLTEELRNKIQETFDQTKLEDIYLPYKRKRQTKADKARKAGLEPLAKMIMSQRGGNPEVMAERFLKGDILEIEDAIEGAQHIMAEWINESIPLRERLREQFDRHSVLKTKLVKGKEQEGEHYKNYFDHSERLSSCPSHRFLAIHRAMNQGVISVKARPDEDKSLQTINRFFVKGNDACAQVVENACKDAWQRLLRGSLENEVLSKAKAVADEKAIDVFAKNLRQLLLAPPLGNKRILAIDPGFRTGCKVVCLDEHGNLLTNATIYPHPPQKERSKASAKISQLVEAYKIDAIAIGDGTAGRETEQLVKHLRFDRDVEVYVVREDGASIYSASSIARKEFPDYDVTVRGSVSIGRRLMDPLAELVKIDPKSIGVGQYQHEVDQSKLKKRLDEVVVSCVNAVGVDVNTASPYLLSYVSGLGSTLAENIVQYRSENGSIRSREELRKVPRLGEKAFEQSAGFLRIKEGENPLDNSAVHPESYSLVEEMAKKQGVTVSDLIGNAELLSRLEKDSSSDEAKFTYQDIIGELKKPGLDPRTQAEVLEFDHRLKTIDDVEVGMQLTGIVTNVTNFGAFVNIGIKENGLIHKSQMADHYVEDPTDIVSLHQHVKVLVVNLDVDRKRIGLKLLS